MGAIHQPTPVTLFLAVLYQEKEPYDHSLSLLATHFGPIEWISQSLPFTFSQYYRSIGEHLLRVFLVFQERIDPGRLPEIKHLTNEFEQHTATPGSERRINLDPGYFDGGKIVLASTKNFSHRVYLGQGIYGEATIRWEKGDFRPFAYTYPDYASPEYRPILCHIRYLHRNFIARLTASPDLKHRDV